MPCHRNSHTDHKDSALRETYVLALVMASLLYFEERIVVFEIGLELGVLLG